MGALLRRWEAVRDDLGVEIVAPYSVQIGNDVTIRAELLVRNFGARNGMLLVTDCEAVWPYIEPLVSLGYGFSVLQEPSDDEGYDRETYIDMLSEWGWSGPKDKKPAWVIDIVD